MIYGDDYILPVGADFDPGRESREELSRLFARAERVTCFASSPAGSMIADPSHRRYDGFMLYKIDEDSLIEINDAFLRSSVVISNEIADIMTFQYVSTVRRSEYIDRRKHVHDLGPSVVVSVVPRLKTTYRMPKANATVRHVTLHTTFSKLVGRMGEPLNSYPQWLRELFSGEVTEPRQRVFFLEDIHRDLLWQCFHIPVSGPILGPWLAAKFQELLCIGVQILKNNSQSAELNTTDLAFPDSNKVRRACTVLNQEYAHPPKLQDLAQQVGLSETRLKSSFKAMYGTSVLQYCINKRMEAARLLLEEQRYSIAEVGDIVGYDDHSAFAKAFRKFSGCTPREWRMTRSDHPEQLD